VSETQHHHADDLELPISLRSLAVRQHATAPPRADAMWDAKWLILLAAIVAAGIAVAASFVVPEQFSSSATVRVSTPTTNGLSQDQVQGQNALANQYVQIAKTPPILDDAKKVLGNEGRGLTGATSASTVANQNLVRISATGDSAGGAARRANAVADAFAHYVNRLNTSAGRAGTSRLTSRLRAVQAELTKSQRKIDDLVAGGAKGRNAQLAQQQDLAALLLSQRQAILSGGASLTPNLDVLARAEPGGRTQPRPVLYALVAFFLVAIATAQVAAFAAAREHRRG
jgi:capsular polysaccharide biosynthesis protein